MSTLSKKNNVAFVLDHDLKPYRIPFFEKLGSNDISITIFHCGEKLEIGAGVKQEIVESVSLGLFKYRRLPSLSEFDLVVHMQNIRLLNLWLMTFNPFRKFKLVHWGIGASSSKGLGNQKKSILFIRNLLAMFSSCQVLYSDYSRQFFSPMVLKKTFVAPNTVHSPYSYDFSKNDKEFFLFIGALNKRKGLDDLLGAFSQYLKAPQSPKINKLVIIGDGPEKLNIEKFILENNLENFVELAGEVKDNKVKLDYFKKSIACVSPKQAGLSVLESFSYGVPFVTYEDAISGGEHLNIVSGQNGFLVKDRGQLVDIMHLLDKNISKSQRLGENAFVFYGSSRKINNMTDGFIDAFKFAFR
jgi:glycosyltransferase involved in cell wall biosynthesis